MLRFLASQADPVTLRAIADAVGLPRSTAYHLLAVMEEEGFVVHLPEEHRYGLGVASFEVGSGYARQEPLQRIARRPLAVRCAGRRTPTSVTRGGRPGARSSRT